MCVHIPVLLAEVLQLLKPERGGSYLDCTYGGGGHTRALLEAAANVRVTALDRDPQAGERASADVERFGGRFVFVDTNFAQLDTAPGAPFDGVLADIGTSSFHFDEAERGFSFKADAPADMRMDPRAGISVADFLETGDEADIVVAVRNHGGEPQWKAVVRAIMAARGTGRLSRTLSLAELVADAVKRPGPPPKIHPATRTFQGLRIFVNAELDALSALLPKAFAALAPGGVLAVISFHSLEDSQVKHFTREMAGRPVDRHDSRTQDMREQRAELLTPHPITPGDAEVAANPRSRSAKLRAIRKL